MPNTREKLIELLKQAPFEGKVLDEWWWEDKIARIADHLIANGVTIADDVSAVAYNLSPTEQKWIPVTERLPDRNDIVIAFYPTMRGTSGEMQIHKAWAMSETCTHWMPLPEPPKGE